MEKYFGYIDFAEGVWYYTNRQKDTIVPLGATKIPEMAVSGIFCSVRFTITIRHAKMKENQTPERRRSICVRR